ncbi:collagenase 3-like isoform X2 [Gouania willdenowi]|uniref:Collagenase 3-like n=1 Tax=Gouania willdenowi TaxID=441366 RepID=A0A8C5EGK2_GOUWI|nr:collagenase 3-like isoform X2 [Gouania willdenowi]
MGHHSPVAKQKEEQTQNLGVMDAALAVKSVTVMMVMVIALCGAVPTETLSQEEQSKAQSYLSRFFSDVGVSPPNSVLRSSLDSFEDTLRKMQEFFGLEVTGQLDSNTLEVMDRPRCGFTDVTRYSHFEGRPKWDKSIITYRVTDYTTDLSHREVDTVLAKALKLYSDVTPLVFKKIDSGTADIMIKFKAAGSNLFVVAAHEFGHALGLAHSQLQTALMYPTYQYVNPSGYKLPDDDKKGVQALYGVRGTPDSRPKPQPRPTSEPLPDRCDRNFNFDAATLIQGNLYFFKDGNVWKKSSSWGGISMKKISSVWAGIDKVDAVYEYKTNNVVRIFKGNQYRSFRGNAALPGFPKSISHFGFPSSVTKVDAAVHVSFTSKTLFFVNNKLWSYDERRGRMDRGYPKFIHRELPGIGSRVDAAFENRGYLYFTNGPRQTEYHYSRRRALRKLLNNRWMDCE